jgi:hypothetical protein
MSKLPVKNDGNKRRRFKLTNPERQ